MNTIYRNLFGGRSGLIGILILCGLLFLAIPLICDTFRLNLVAKYLSLAFVAVGLVLFALRDNTARLEAAATLDLSALSAANPFTITISPLVSPTPAPTSPVTYTIATFGTIAGAPASIDRARAVIVCTRE